MGVLFFEMPCYNPLMQTYVAYYRVSTERQGRSGLGLEAQRKAVADFISSRGELAGEFTEIESGRRNDRPQLVVAIKACQRKPRSILVIAKLDRLARNVAFIANLMESHVEFVAVDMPDANRFTLHLMAAFAEHEQEMASTRTRAALAAAKVRGTRLGNPHPAQALALACQASRQQADAFALPIRPLIESMRCEGRTLQAIADVLNMQGLKTARQKEWRPQTVQNIISRLIT
jgi:DNA invertase Pin-like site-specific DNA recombinase